MSKKKNKTKKRIYKKYAIFPREVMMGEFLENNLPSPMYDEMYSIFGVEGTFLLTGIALKKFKEVFDNVKTETLSTTDGDEG